MKLKKIKDALGMDTISKRYGIITVRKQFFYRDGRSSELYESKVKALFKDVEIIDSGEHYASFKGGSDVRNSSHWWVKFKIKKE